MLMNLTGLVLLCLLIGLLLSLMIFFEKRRKRYPFLLH